MLEKVREQRIVNCGNSRGCETLEQRNVIYYLTLPSSVALRFRTLYSVVCSRYGTVEFYRINRGGTIVPANVVTLFDLWERARRRFAHFARLPRSRFESVFSAFNHRSFSEE